MKDEKQVGVMPIHQPKSEAGVPEVRELQLQVTIKKLMRVLKLDLILDFGLGGL